ncbi:MAG TPA: DUF4870 domain-containing protein [Vicinamibacterales bacterium]
MSDPTPVGSTPSGNRTIMIVLSYLWLLALVPLLVEKNDKEVQWHAKHGIVLMVAEIVLWIVLFIVQMIVGRIPGLGCLFAIVGALISIVLWLGALIVHILCIVKGVNGQRFTLPYISQYADQF